VVTLEGRRAHVEAFLHESGLEDFAVITPATLKTEVNFAQLRAMNKINNSHLVAGEIACTQSHHHVLRQFINDTTLTHAIVFEDDVVPNPNVLRRLQASKGKNGTSSASSSSHVLVSLIEELAATSHTLGWHGLNLGRCYDYCDVDVDLQRVSSASYDGNASPPLRIVHSCRPLCTHAYMMTRDGAEHLLWTKVYRSAEDVRRQEMSRFGNLRYFSVTPRVFDQARAEGGGAGGINEKQGAELPECQPMDDPEAIHENIRRICSASLLRKAGFQ